MSKFEHNPFERKTEEGQKKEKAEVLKTSLEELGEKEAQEILARAEITGDKFRGKELTREFLKERGLEPRYRIRIGDKVITFSSSAYKLSGEGYEGYLAAEGFVESKTDEGKKETKVRSYLRSRSAGLWRYFPGYWPRENKEEKKEDIYWFGKGFGEGSITLPIEMQKALYEISQKGSLELEGDGGLVAFAGASKRLSKEEVILYQKLYRENSPNKRKEIAKELKEKGLTDYRKEINPVPTLLEGNFYGKNISEKVAPEKLEFSDKNFNPDFETLLDSWNQQSEMYGETEIEIFASKNKKLKFMFCRDAEGRAWIGGIDNDSEIQSTGLRKEWIDAGGLMTPAFEHKTETGDYGNEEETRYDGEYQDMFKNYLSKVPVVKEYLKSVESREGEVE